MVNEYIRVQNKYEVYSYFGLIQHLKIIKSRWNIPSIDVKKKLILAITALMKLLMEACRPKYACRGFVFLH